MSVPWMVVTGLVVLLIGAPAAQAHHTPPPSTVALVGSLQSELGCPGDWQPECPQTRLQPVAGSPGAFRASSTSTSGYRLQGRAQQHVGRELRRGRGARRRQHRAHGARRNGHLHVRSRHARDRRRRSEAPAERAWRPLVRTGVIAWRPPARAKPVALRARGWPAHRERRDRRRRVSAAHARSGGLPADVRAEFPHLASWTALELAAETRRLARPAHRRAA